MVMPQQTKKPASTWAFKTLGNETVLVFYRECIRTGFLKCMKHVRQDMLILFIVVINMLDLSQNCSMKVCNYFKKYDVTVTKK